MFQAHTKYLTRLLLSPDVKYVFVRASSSASSDDDGLSRYLATCSADHTVKIWSISPNYEFKLEKTMQGHQRWVWDCAFSADSAYLVTGALWCTETLTNSIPHICTYSILGPHRSAVGHVNGGDSTTIQRTSEMFGSCTVTT